MSPAQLPAHRALLVLLATAGIALSAGCSGDDQVRESRPVVTVTLDEYAIAPQDVSVPSGRVELVARNVGRLTHNLRVEIPPESPEEQAEPIGGTPTAQPGQTVRVTLGLKPGTYRMRCSLANHDDLGMYGELLVRGKGRG